MSSSSGHNQPQLLGRGGVDDRGLYFAHIQAADEWPDDLDAPEPHFVAFLAMDATSVDGDEIGALAKRLMNQGWCTSVPGAPTASGCTTSSMKRGRTAGETDNGFVVTSWFDDKDLDDALWDAIFAVPADDYIETCRAVVAIVVDQPKWSERVEAALADFETFNENVLARDRPTAPVELRTFGFSTVSVNVEPRRRRRPERTSVDRRGRLCRPRREVR